MPKSRISPTLVSSYKNLKKVVDSYREMIDNAQNLESAIADFEFELESFSNDDSRKNSWGKSVILDLNEAEMHVRDAQELLEQASFTLEQVFKKF